MGPTFRTARGEIPLEGEPDARPLVLGIGGSFDRVGTCFEGLGGRLPEASVVLAQLPGNHSPPLSESSLAAIAASFDEVVSALGRPVVVCGGSTGALVALAMRSPWVAARVAVEPPLRTGKLWPLIPRLQAMLAQDPPAHVRDYIEQVLGVTATSVVDRDYRGLLEGLGPTWGVLGDVPLMPVRTLPRFPSFVDGPERDLLAERGVRIMVAGGCGHDVPGQAGTPIVAAVRAALTA